MRQTLRMPTAPFALALTLLSACADDPAPTELETESAFQLGGVTQR